MGFRQSTLGTPSEHKPKGIQDESTKGNKSCQEGTNSFFDPTKTQWAGKGEYERNSRGKNSRIRELMNLRNV